MSTARAAALQGLEDRDTTATDLTALRRLLVQLDQESDNQGDRRICSLLSEAHDTLEWLTLEYLTGDAS